MLQKSILQSQPLFSKVSELTAWMLVSEAFEKRKFKKGEKILEMSKYAPTHSYFRRFYDMRSSKFAERMK